jgi:hypothetical protein
MEYDDRYTPLEANDYDDSNFNKDSALKKSKVLNRGYHKIFRNVLFSNNKNTKKVEIGVYGSGSHESPIRNAETGEYYKYKVGTMDEDLFFKVMISSGEIPTGPITLFYDSPEHYERHQYLELDEVTKKRWEVKRQSRINILNQQSRLTIKSRL